MASLRSLGVHTPAALPYLISESILREDATDKDYSWETYCHDENGQVAEEELVWTQYCVVWSRGGVVQKVFNFEVEEQQVVQAVLTWFPKDEAVISSEVQGETLRPRKARGHQKASDFAHKRLEREPKEEVRERALVVFLKLQAHVFFLAGSAHIVNLPFEVEKAFPTPKGLILQRKITIPGFVPSTPILPSAPPNSFFSSQQTIAQPSFILNPSFANGRKSKHSRSNTATGRFLDDLLKEASAPLNDDLPRFFSFTDPLSELGLVVDASHEAPFNASQRSSADRPLEPVDRAEELVYVSKESELPIKNLKNDRPLILVVTANHQSRNYSVWNVSFSSSRPSASGGKHRDSLLPTTKSRRRSSYGPTPGTGTTTPGLRGGMSTQVMESFAAAPKGKQTKETDTSKNKSRRGHKSAEDELASRLDPDYGISGQPAKESRRVSSLLSRADLNTSFDKTAFQDMATHRTSFGASFGSQSRRGHSMGGYGDRTSMGRTGHRASTPGSVSRLSLGTVSLDDTFEETIDDSSDDASDGGFGLFHPTRGLRKEVMMTKIAEFPFGESASIFKASFINASKEEKDRLKVFCISTAETYMSLKSIRQTLFLHIVDRPSRRHVQVELSVQTKKRLKRRSSVVGAAQQPFEPYDVFVPELVKVDQLQGHLDATKIGDKQVDTVLTLVQPSPGEFQLSLHSERKSFLPLTFGINDLKLFNPYSLNNASPSVRQTAGLKRTLSIPRAFRGFTAAGADGSFDLVDDEGKSHRLQLQLSPTNPSVRKIFSLFRAIFSSQATDLLLSIWWSIFREIDREQSIESEWIALAATVFSLPVHFVDKNSIPPCEKHGQKRTSRKRRSLNRSLSGGSTDADWPWEFMWGCEAAKSQSSVWSSPAWDWAAAQIPSNGGQARLTRSGASKPGSGVDSSAGPTTSQNDFILQGISVARRFLDSPLGRAANDQWRRISTAKGEDVRSIYIPQMLVALHLLREEEKLNILTQQSDLHNGYLSPILAQLGHWLRWDAWSWKMGSYYNLEAEGFQKWSFEDSSVTLDRLFPPPWERPPSVYEWIDQAFTQTTSYTFPLISRLVKDDQNGAGNGPYGIDAAMNTLTPRTIALSKIVGQLERGTGSPTEVVESAVEAGINQRMLETLPEAFSMHLHEAIIACQPSPPTTWPSLLLRLIGREDLDTITSKEPDWKHSQSLLVEPTRDIHTICQLAEQAPSPLNTHPEHDRLQTSRLIFSQDRRYIEAMKLLDPTRQNVAECPPDPSWDDAEYLDAQKGVIQLVMLRTFALPPGNSMMHFNVRRPLPTEKYQLHGFSTSCLMKPLNNIVTADRSSFTEEKFGWAFFHAGVNHGLTIAKDAKGIDTSWVVFNKPADLTNKHAGLLLGLGLNGHLKKLAKWLAFKYLTTKHTMTTVGLLLGFSASYLGTMDTLVTRMISIHVTRMLPLGAAELNNSPLVQTTGLMGIGLLYCNTQHRRMSEIMLSEIEHVDEYTDPSEPPDTLRDECYRLSAGFALGFINVGKGKDLRGLHDMRIVERLLAVAVGTKPVDIVHIVDQAVAGATIALALIFMKTHDEAVARKIDVPDTLPQFDYVRPDIFLLRTLAKHLIMWNGIEADHRWMIKNLPKAYQDKYTLKDIKTLRSEHMPFYNIVAGLLWSIGLKHAGSGDTRVRDFLIQYLDQFIRLCRLPALRYDSKLARNAVRNCQDLVAISAATVMAGTGDLDVFRRLRALHGRIGAEVPYGSHLASHFAIGALFMAGGTHTFGTSNIAIAALVCAFYPLFPMDVLDNKAHLQALRHLWVLAAEPRCLVIRDVDTHRAISLPVRLHMKDGTTRNITAPCLLPEIDTISMIKTASPEYWQVTLDFANNPTHLSSFRATQTIQVRHRPSREAHSSLFSSTLASLNASAIAASAGHSSSTGVLKFDWLFKLPTFAEFDKADWELVLPNDNNSSVNMDMRSTAVDTRLVLREQPWGKTRDELMGLKILFSWAERVMQEGGRERPKWVGREVVGRLKKDVLERGRKVCEEL